MLTVYGIPNCDTVKKARVWLDKNNVPYTFYDFRKEGLEKEKVEKWVTELPWEKVFNKNSTTWKELPAEKKEQVTNAEAAVYVILSHSSIIKRPLIEDESGKAVQVGFNEKDYAEKFLH